MVRTSYSETKRTLERFIGEGGPTRLNARNAALRTDSLHLDVDSEFLKGAALGERELG